MLERLNQILTIIMASCVGVFVGHAVYVYQDYYNHPNWYAMRSAPWYVSILLYGALTIVVLIVGILGKMIVRWKMKGSEKK